MEMDHVDGRHSAVGLADVRSDADDPTVLSWLRDSLLRVRDVVLTGFDGDRTDFEVQSLRARGYRVTDGLRRGFGARPSRGARTGRLRPRASARGRDERDHKERDGRDSPDTTRRHER